MESQVESTADTQLSSQELRKRNLRILIASDIHLGYMDKSPERRRDTVETFEEILEIANKQEVDFVLFAGDLFHVNDPPKWILQEATRLLRKHCLNSRDVMFKIESDVSKNFAGPFPHANYEDENLNVGMPVFTIHGNHDDPVGVNNESIVSILSTAGLVNYFGKVNDLSYITLEPILIRKRKVKLALYGLGSIRDERLHNLFVEDKVEFVDPPDDDYYRIFVIHQNRVPHGPGKYIRTSFIPNKIDLIIWGHEHDCIMDFESTGNSHICQPGSTVATSLTAGEALPKHVGVLTLGYNKAMKCHESKIEKIPLKTVRQLYIEDVILSEMKLDRFCPMTVMQQQINFLSTKIDRLIVKSVPERSGHRKQPTKPLIRLRVLHGPEHETFLPNAVGKEFKDRIANPSDCIHFVRDPSKYRKARERGDIDEEAYNDVLEEQQKSTKKVEELIASYFKQIPDDKKLTVLSENSLSVAIGKTIETEEKYVVGDAITHAIECMINKLKVDVEGCEENDVMESMLEIGRDTQYKQEADVSFQKMLSSAPVQRASNVKVKVKKEEDTIIEQVSSDDDYNMNKVKMSESVTKPARGRGSRGGRARGASTSTRGTRGRGRGSSRPITETIFDSDDDEIPSSMRSIYANGRSQVSQPSKSRARKLPGSDDSDSASRPKGKKPKVAPKVSRFNICDDSDDDDLFNSIKD